MAAEAFWLAALGQIVGSGGDRANARASDQFELGRQLGGVEQLVGPDRDLDGEAVGGRAGVDAALVEFLFDRLDHRDDPAAVEVLRKRSNGEADVPFAIRLIQLGL